MGRVPAVLSGLGITEEGEAAPLGRQWLDGRGCSQKKLSFIQKPSLPPSLSSSQPPSFQGAPPVPASPLAWGGGARGVATQCALGQQHVMLRGHASFFVAYLAPELPLPRLSPHHSALTLPLPPQAFFLVIGVRDKLGPISTWDSISWLLAYLISEKLNLATPSYPGLVISIRTNCPEQGAGPRAPGFRGRDLRCANCLGFSP